MVKLFKRVLLLLQQKQQAQHRSQHLQQLRQRLVLVMFHQKTIETEQLLIQKQMETLGQKIVNDKLYLKL